MAIVSKTDLGILAKATENQISDDLFEHIDGMESFVREGDPLKLKPKS